MYTPNEQITFEFDSTYYFPTKYLAISLFVATITVTWSLYRSIVLGALELVKFRRRAHLILDHLLTDMLGIFHLRNGDILYVYCHHRFMLNIKSG